VITHFEHAICRYNQDDLIRRVFTLMGFPSPPRGKARVCADEVLKKGGVVEAVAAVMPNSNDILAQREKLAGFLEMLDVPKIVLTADQVNAPTLIGRTLCVASRSRRAAVEIHAGIGALFHCGERGTLISQVAPITGTGMETRRDYLLSVVEANRTLLEQQFS
jgi:hypothetical protein